MTNPLSILRGKYQGPGAQEWALGLAAAVLLAADVQAKVGAETVQTAQRYYFRVPGVSVFQGISLVVDALVVVAVLAWLIWPTLRKVSTVVLMACAVTGPPVVWGELVLALLSQRGAVYLLTGLPFRPVNNFGLIGSTVFWLYLVSRQRFAPKLWIDVLAKAALAVGVVVGQMWVFQTLAARWKG